MNNHDYSPDEALATLMKAVRGADAELASRIQRALDAGKDITETDASGGKGTEERKYRMAVPLSTEEALLVVMNALEASIVELPLILNSTTLEFQKSVIGVQAAKSPRGFWMEFPVEIISRERQDEAKDIEFELKTETQLGQEDKETMSMEAIDVDLIAEQKNNIALLRTLTTFEIG